MQNATQELAVLVG